MWDRYDPRDNDRDRDGSERAIVGRGSTGDRNWRDERDLRDVFTRDLDLPRGRERRPVRERDRVYEIDGTEKPNPRHRWRISRRLGERSPGCGGHA